MKLPKNISEEYENLFSHWLKTPLAKDLKQFLLKTYQQGLKDGQKEMKGFLAAGTKGFLKMLAEKDKAISQLLKKHPARHLYQLGRADAVKEIREKIKKMKQKTPQPVLGLAGPINTIERINNYNQALTDILKDIK